MNQTTDATYEVTFSVFGADVKPQWKRTITSAVRVKATSALDAAVAAMKQVPTLTVRDIVGVGVRS